MRSKSTNFLQGTVLLTGIVYIVIGLVFAVSPYRAFRLFSINTEGKFSVTLNNSEGESVVKTVENPEFSEDDWLKQIINDEIISPLYYIFRIFAILLTVCGLAMIMPLFDPLRYRGLIYYNALVFPLVSFVMLVIFMQSQKAINIKIAADMGKGGVTWQVGHQIMTVLAAMFAVICILTAISLIITQKQTKEGRE